MLDFDYPYKTTSFYYEAENQTIQIASTECCQES